MTYEITELNLTETQIVSGGVIEGPHGEGCTEPRIPTRPTLSMEQGGPLQVNFGRFF